MGSITASRLTAATARAAARKEPAARPRETRGVELSGSDGVGSGVAVSGSPSFDVDEDEVLVVHERDALPLGHDHDAEVPVEAHALRAERASAQDRRRPLDRGVVVALDLELTPALLTGVV